MKFHDRHAWAAYESPYLAITFRRRDARLAFLGIDSGGRRWDHKNTYNLLKPSQGALVPAIDRVAKKPPETSRKRILLDCGIFLAVLGLCTLIGFLFSQLGFTDANIIMVYPPTGSRSPRARPASPPSPTGSPSRSLPSTTARSTSPSSRRTAPRSRARSGR